MWKEQVARAALVAFAEGVNLYEVEDLIGKAFDAYTRVVEEESGMASGSITTKVEEPDPEIEEDPADLEDDPEDNGDFEDDDEPED